MEAKKYIIDWLQTNTGLNVQSIYNFAKEVDDLYKQEKTEQCNIDSVTQRSEPCEGNCGMSYCDDNGCVDRKRNLLEPKDLPEHGVVVPKGTLPCKNHRVEYVGGKNICLNKGCDWQADVVFTR
jgi:hypothetical protein